MPRGLCGADYLYQLTHLELKAEEHSAMAMATRNETSLQTSHMDNLSFRFKESSQFVETILTCEGVIKRIITLTI